MGERTHTPGPWLRDGRTVYALDERKNANRFSFHVQEGYLHHTRHERVRTPDEELEATAAIAQAEPEMFDALLNVKGLLDTPLARRRHDGDPFYEDVVASLNAALSKASPHV